MDLGFGKYRKFYIVGMILRSLVTSFMPNYGTLKAWQTNETYQPLGNVPTGGYVSKRNLLCNRPLLICQALNDGIESESMLLNFHKKMHGCYSFIRIVFDELLVKFGAVGRW